MRDFYIEFGHSRKAEEVAQKTYRFYFDLKTGDHKLFSLFSESSVPTTFKPCDFSDKGYDWFLIFAKAWLDREGYDRNQETAWIGFLSRVEFRRGRWCWKNKYHS